MREDLSPEELARKAWTLLRAGQRVAAKFYAAAAVVRLQGSPTTEEQRALDADGMFSLAEQLLGR